MFLSSLRVALFAFLLAFPVGLPTCLLAPAVSPLAFLLALLLVAPVLVLALLLVALRPLFISLHATLQCSTLCIVTIQDIASRRGLGSNSDRRCWAGSPDAGLEVQDIDSPMMHSGRTRDADISAAFRESWQGIGGPCVLV